MSAEWVNPTLIAVVASCRRQSTLIRVQHRILTMSVNAAAHHQDNAQHVKPYPSEKCSRSSSNFQTCLSLVSVNHFPASLPLSGPQMQSECCHKRRAIPALVMDSYDAGGMLRILFMLAKMVFAVHLLVPISSPQSHVCSHETSTGMHPRQHTRLRVRSSRLF